MRLYFLLLVSLVFAPLFLDFVDQSHEHATHLLPFIDVNAIEEAKRAWAAETQSDIEDLSEKLLMEEQKLFVLEEQRQLRKDTFLWYFDTTKRLAVERLTLEVNDQRRVVNNMLEEITYLWLQLKPLLGVQSSMCMRELFASFLTVLDELSHVLLPSLSFTVFSLLVFGPFFFSLMLLWSFVGMTLFPILWTLFSAYWVTVKVPQIIVSYGPSLPEFGAVYMSVLVMLSLQTVLLFRVCGVRSAAGNSRNQTHLSL